jgi:hypothetical protein
MNGYHGRTVRGLEAEAKRPEFEGRFGRMFARGEVTYGSTPQEQLDNLQRLAAGMVATFDAPKDGPDGEESGIPALYTYLGQFVDHDLTFDPDGSFQKEKDPYATEDFRSPAFDLDSVYGRGPGDQPYLYDSDGKSFLLGDPLTLGSEGARDLQRNAVGRALIGDPRNDENAIVSQLQGLFLRFHNRTVKENPNLPFKDVQRRVRHHYQYVVMNDFLPKIVHKSVLDALKTNGAYDKAKLEYYKYDKYPFMPIEFSVAAYRLGHSMVRPGYRLNDAILLPIFPVKDTGEQPPTLPEGLTGFRRVISDWGIDWARFIDIEERAYGSTPGKVNLPADFRRLQFAYRIDTSLVDPLGSLPASVVNNDPKSLAFRNLQRGQQFKLPTGQEVAKAMEVKHLEDEEILIGKGVEESDEPGEPHEPLPNILRFGQVFAGRCPLWTYILAEAMHNKVSVPIPATGGPSIPTPQLGPVGGRIVAEVFLGLMFADPGSYLSMSPGWVPAGGAGYALKDFVRFALG